MSRRMRADAVVVGGGVVGAACALALARQDLRVELVEAAPPRPWSAGTPDLRVFALAADNVALLDSLGAWESIRGARAHPFRRMRVWDAAGGDELDFDGDAFGRQALGWIVENGLLVDRLWAALEAAGVELHCPAKVAGFGQDDEGVRLELEDGGRIAARVAIAADGANSALRRMSGVGTCGRDYGQRGVVGYVQTERPHEDTAWQRFLPGGPLAFLPCGDGTSSIVWSLPDDQAARVLALDDDAFANELARAFEGRLGNVDVRSPRAAFPLRLQLADAALAGRLLLLGDAAHVVHPLAGQGVNLGLRDVAGLRELVAGAAGNWDSPHRLRRWARRRRSENTMAALAFDGIDRVFSNEAVLPTLLRGRLFGAAARVPPVAHLLWRRAAGL